MQAWFEQLLRVVYRLIFLAVAEDRDMLLSPGIGPAVRSLYLDGYGFAHLRDRSVRRSAHDHHFDAWEGAKIVFRGLEHGEKLLGLPALGGIFARGLTPDLDDTKLPNRAFMAAIFKLSWLMDDDRRVRINWRDMATEELGSVYEGLLELVPVREDHGRTFAFAGGEEARGNARKVSGSYYTPDSLVQTLLDSALDPVLDRAEAEGGAEAILALNVIDPACGSGHFLLGAARRMATRVAQLRDNDAPDYPAAMRDVARNCIHGVDRNPMAVELAKVALWIETVESGKPLGFLDANIQCGDSLLGIFDLKALEEGIPDDAYKPLTGDDKETAKWFARRNKAEKTGQGTFDWARGGGGLPPAKLAADMDDLRHLPEDTVEEVEAKRKRFAAWRNDPKRWAAKVACDLYIAAFLLPKKGGVPAIANGVTIPTTAHVRARLGGGTIYGPLEAAAIDAAEFARGLHWPLAFPEAVIARSGFDVVLGNPPWERIKLQEREFFATRDVAVASAKHASLRHERIRKLADSPEGSAERQLYDQFELAKRTAEAASAFARVGGQDGGRFDRAGRGDVNTYALFAELCSNLIRQGGRAGFIVPTGLATDLTTSVFFSHLVKAGELIQILGFENEEFIFPEVHNATKFSIFTLGKDGSGRNGARYVFFLRNVAGAADVRRYTVLNADEIGLINPNTSTAPVFRSLADAKLAVKIHRNVPVLFGEGGGNNLWNIRFLSMFHMANDSDKFVDLAAMGSRGKGLNISGDRGLHRSGFVALYEGKMFHQFNHRHGTYHRYAFAAGKQVKEVPPPTLDELIDPSFEIEARYWVDAAEQRERLDEVGWKRGWLIGYRKISGARTRG
jgi:hypothetical protein